MAAAIKFRDLTFNSDNKLEKMQSYLLYDRFTLKWPSFAALLHTYPCMISVIQRFNHTTISAIEQSYNIAKDYFPLTERQYDEVTKEHPIFLAMEILANSGKKVYPIESIANPPCYRGCGGGGSLGASTRFHVSTAGVGDTAVFYKEIAAQNVATPNIQGIYHIMA